MTLVLRYAVRSDVGLLREGNEDSAYAGPRLLAVADGMGGHAAGEVASSLTIASMAELDSQQPGGDMLTALSSAVASANARLQQKILANPAVEGMGTTLTALLWSDGHAAVCHIGDSRGYLLRDGELYQITHDHTLVQSLVDEGRISADDVSTHPQRSLLLRALDGRSAAEPDLSVHESLADDRYLLCSDGLSGVVSDETLREVLATITDPDSATRELIELAIAGGGPDNITCIVADVVDTATSRLAPTTTPVLAGAAASVGDLRWADGADPLGSFDPFGGLEDHHGDHTRAARTAPQPVVAGDEDPSVQGDPGSVALAMANENGNGSLAARRRGHRAQPERAQDDPESSASRGSSGRRRWPIVTTALVVLVAVILGGGYIAWRWSQDQYYVAANSKGEVVIYRGINQRIAGIDLSSPYELTGIPLDQVPSNYQQAVKTAYGTGSLAEVRQIAANVAAAVKQCQQQYTALQGWATAEARYQAAIAQANRLRKPTKSIAKPGAQPPGASAMCPPSQAFGIPASALAPAPAGHS
jgi:PPM family protein phosphatase